MIKNFDWKKLITAPNIMIVILVVLYLFDCYLPLPDGYTGYNGWVDDLSPTANYILGYCEIGRASCRERVSINV